MDYVYHKLECHVCGRKILVERWLIGVSHTTHTSVSCADCIPAPDEKFKKEQPEAAQDIQDWINAPVV